MTVVQFLVGVLVSGFLVILVIGLATRRIAWRQESCCAPSDPRRDTRMADAFRSEPDR